MNLNVDTEAVEKLQEAADAYSDEFSEFLASRTDMACLNWLRVYGIPKTPNDVYEMFRVLYSALPAALIVEGFIALTEKGTAPAEAAAQRTAERKGQQSLFSAQGLAKLAEEAFGGKVTNPGGYI